MLKDALAQMAEVFLPTVLMRGQDYYKKGNVLSIRFSEGLLKARVKGQANQIYDVHIDLKMWPQKSARCSCPVGLNCKHVVASLFALQVRENIEVPAPAHQPSQPSLNEWLLEVRAGQLEQAKAEKTHQISYLLNLVRHQQNQYDHRVLVRLALAKRLKKGGLGKKVPFNTITAARKQYFSCEDDSIINTLLSKYNITTWFDFFPLRNSELLEKILATQRAYSYGEVDDLLLLGQETPISLSWHLQGDGCQQLIFKAHDKIITPLFLDVPWYVDVESRTLGLMQLPCTIQQLKEILIVSPVPLEKVEKLVARMTADKFPLPFPKQYENKITKQIKPNLVLNFSALETDTNNLFWLEEIQTTNFGKVNDPITLFTADLSFEYQDQIVQKNEQNSSKLVYESGDTLIIMSRDLNRERQLIKEANQLLNLRSPNIIEKIKFELDFDDKKILSHYHHEHDLPRFYNHIIPLLKNKGWRFNFLHPIYKELINDEEIEWFSELDEQGNDFFSYQLGILIEGKPVNIVPLIAQLITKFDGESLDKLADDHQVSLPLANNKLLQINMGRIKPLIRFLLQYGTRTINEDERLRINRYQLILMQETEQALSAIAVRWHSSDKIYQQLQQLQQFNTINVVEIPQGLQATLRDYQHQGLNWLQFLRESRLGGILADDMGLGKTVQALAHMLVEKEQGRLTKASLIVAPTSLVMNWFAEAQRFTPQLKVLVFHGQGRHQDDFDHYDLIISTYGLIQRDKIRFIEYPFYYLILDEAQSIKNARAKTTQIIQQIKASHRLCLSGTPLENHLGELWSLFHFLMPGLLGDDKQFRHFFKKPIEKDNNHERRQLLAGRVRPFMLRRDKNQVACELPAKTEIIQTIELEGRQRDLYETIRMSMEKKVREAIAQQGMGKSHIVLLDALLKLRQVCCDPKLVNLTEAAMAHGCSAKFDALFELLENLIAENRRVLIFSQFTTMLEIIEQELIKRDYGYLKLTGQSKNRHLLVNQFQEGNTPFFLISLKAGGTGLNLTRADTVIHYDPWWNPAAEDQATDRSHRIGQVKPVFVYKLITAGTVEEAILAMQNKKRALFEGILADNATSLTTLTDADLERFFLPLSE